jgi:hypothetical protein
MLARVILAAMLDTVHEQFAEGAGEVIPGLQGKIAGHFAQKMRCSIGGVKFTADIESDPFGAGGDNANVVLPGVRLESVLHQIGEWRGRNRGAKVPKRTLPDRVQDALRVGFAGQNHLCIRTDGAHASQQFEWVEAVASWSRDHQIHRVGAKQGERLSGFGDWLDLTVVALQEAREVCLNDWVGLDEQQAAGVQKITTLFNLAEVQHNMAVAPLSTGRGGGREGRTPMASLRKARLSLRNQEWRARITSSNVKSGILLLVASAAAMAQVYPPGGGYPGTIPGQSPIPGTRPTTRGRTGAGADPRANSGAQPLPNFRGTLKVMADKSLSLLLGDQRVLDFKRTDKTKFYKGGDEVKNPKFNVGDQLSVEALDELTGTMTAVNVYWEKAAGAPGTTTKTDDGVTDAWKDIPPSPPPTSSVQRTADDPGPPKLQRGGAADKSRERADAVPVEAPPDTRSAERVTDSSPNRPSLIRGDGDEDSVRIPIKKDEPLIRKAADAAMEFTETLPSYVCTELVTRTQSAGSPSNFQPIDIVSMEVLYENGKEDYRNIQINGKKTVKKLEESGGAWSTGEFGTILVNLFSPSTAAAFHYRRDSRAGGIMAKMYDYEVEKERSTWSIHAASASYDPAFTGSVWIDPQTSRVLRIEMEAKGMPSNFPLDHVESATDYQYIRLGDAKQYLLPVHSETLSCERGTNYCSRNVIDFRNYHKYTGESSIKFGGDPKDKDK